MVEQNLTQKIQQALVAGLNKRFDGQAYIGSVHHHKFVIDFYAYDKIVVTEEMITDYISDFTATEGDDEYSLSITTIPDTDYKYQYVITIEEN